MGRGILKKGLSAISSKAPKSVKFLIDNVDPEKILEYGYKGVTKGAKFINRFWRGKAGSFLIERGGYRRRRMQQAMIPYPVKKRSRSTVRTKSGTKYRKVSSSALLVRDADKHGYAVKGRFKSLGYRKQKSYFMKKVMNVVRGMADTYIDRRFNSSQIVFADGKRTDLYLRTKDWIYDPVTGYRDFLTTNATATDGFLDRLPVGRLTTVGATTTNDNLQVARAGLNRWTKTADAEVRVLIKKSIMTAVMRNNSQYSVHLDIYVLYAKQDIPASGSGVAASHNPSFLWSDYLVGSNTTAAEIFGQSNLAITAASILADHPETSPYHGKQGWYAFYGIESHKRLTLYPGDEVKQFVKERTRLYSMKDLEMRFTRFTNGVWMLKGEKILYVVARGGIGHDSVTPTNVNFIGLSGDAIDIEYFREHHGCLYTEQGRKFFNFANTQGTITAGNSTQWGSGVSRQT